MIGYVTVGTNKMDEAAAFSITKPYDGGAASVGNGVMIAIAMDTTEKVDAFHAKALQLGGTDEGAPGFRVEKFYAGYFRDLDGNKLNAFCFNP